MPVSLTSELWRALQTQKADVEIMRCIARRRSPNVSNIAEELGIDRKSVRYHLYKLKAEGCVRDRWVGMTSPVGNQILCHEWPLTEKGERLLREGGIIFPVLLCNVPSPAREPVVGHSNHKSICSMLQTGASNSGVNQRRAGLVATVFRAFSLTCSRSRTFQRSRKADPMRTRS